MVTPHRRDAPRCLDAGGQTPPARRTTGVDIAAQLMAQLGVKKAHHQLRLVGLVAFLKNIVFQDARASPSRCAPKLRALGSRSQPSARATPPAQCLALSALWPSSAASRCRPWQRPRRFHRHWDRYSPAPDCRQRPGRVPDSPPLQRWPPAPARDQAAVRRPQPQPGCSQSPGCRVDALAAFLPFALVRHRSTVLDCRRRARCPPPAPGVAAAGAVAPHCQGWRCF